MKRNVILLVDADPDTCAATLTAARTAGFDVRFGQIQRDLSEITEFGLDDIAMIVLDYDPDGHGPEIAKALAQWLPPRPLIFISSDGAVRRPRMPAGGAAKHLTKPVTAQQIAHAIQAVASTCEAQAPCSDRWGHPCSTLCHSTAHEERDELVFKNSQKTGSGNL
jgi:FixJ family two-component response regulator